MAILIFNMDMPENCGERPLNHDNDYCVLTRTGLWNNAAYFDYHKKRITDCPLVDAETIFDIASESARPPKQETTEKEYNIWYEYNQWLKRTRAETKRSDLSNGHLFEAVKKVSTWIPVDPAYEEYQCPRCGKIETIFADKETGKLWKFCPHCGMNVGEEQ